MDQSVTEQIKDRLPITDVLASYITLIPAGKAYKAKCPFHNERTASFSVSPDRGLYYCFGCGVRGDIFTFVQEFEGVDFNGALKILAERAGVPLTRSHQKKDDLDGVYEFLEKATLRYQSELLAAPDALLYLKGRGISEESIAQFRLGYAPTQWRFIADESKDAATARLAIRAGLIKEPEDRTRGAGAYDRFRGRIMFPLADSSGRVIGFSGRMFPEVEDGPKYLNSPETEVFQKSRILYGFDKAKFHIKRVGFAILVEGQMDLVVSHQAGFKNTVATSGTALSEQSVEDARSNLVAISRLTPHLFLAFDGDAAGKKALARAAAVALGLGMNPKVVELPEGKDPADCIISEGPERWKERLSTSTHFILYQSAALAAAVPSAHMLVKRLREEVLPFILLVPSPVERTLYLESVAKELSLDVRELASELAALAAKQPREAHVPLDETTMGTAAPLSAAERFAAFVECFDDEALLSLKEKVLGLSFAGEHIAVVSLSDERRPAILAQIERDYVALSDADRQLTAAELAVAATQEFYLGVHRMLAKALRDAERAGDDARAHELLSQLSMLSKLRQER